MLRSRSTLIATAALAAAAVTGASVVTADGAPRRPAPKPVIKRVAIGDNYYLPLTLRVRKDTWIRWVWPTDVGDTHDVKLGTGPRGFTRFTSSPANTNFVYKKKLTRIGTYKIICTFHDDMKQTIIVRR